MSMDRLKGQRLWLTIAISGLAVVSGCATHTDRKAAPTIASGHAALTQNGTYPSGQVGDHFNPQASRNNGAWGAVVVSARALSDRATNANVVNSNRVPSVVQDPELAKWQDKFTLDSTFTSNNGAQLYRNSCAGCHMHQGQGAQGAGYYPPLANNSKMQSKYYVIDVVLNGLRGMPPFAGMLDDQQIAAITQYVQTNLNHYPRQVRPHDVDKLRHQQQPKADPSL